jgi:hypothetical protein
LPGYASIVRSAACGPEIALFWRLVLCAAAVLWPAASFARDESPKAAGGYDALFLERADVKVEMERTADHRGMGSDPADADFSRHKGVHFGFASWESPRGPGALWQITDIRWVFATPAAAAAYHRETLQKHAEGAAEIAGAPAPAGAADVHVFGGSRTVSGVKVSNYFYIFTVGRVVVKLFVAAAPDPTGFLKPESVVRLADKVVARIQSARLD